MDYNKKIEEMEKELDKKRDVVSILEKIKNDMKWDAMKATDERTEEGDIVFIEPTEDDWCYDKYFVYKEVIDLIEKHYFK